MTSLPVSARPRLHTRPLPARTARTDVPAHARLRRGSDHSGRFNPAPPVALVHSARLGLSRAQPSALAFVISALLILLTAALLLDTFRSQGEPGLQTRLWLQVGMLAGLLGLRSQMQRLSVRQTRDSGLARSDELTGVPNRRALNEQLQALLGGRDQGGPTIQGRGQDQHVWSLLLIDIDHFKAVNDTHGHLAGDEVLKAMVMALRHELRESDMLGRWGGEEFLALLPATGFEGALVAAERLRRAVSLRTFPYVGSVTVSIGVASCLPGDNLERVVARADAGMYTAKRGGRNRVAFTE